MIRSSISHRSKRGEVTISTAFYPGCTVQFAHITRPTREELRGRSRIVKWRSCCPGPFGTDISLLFSPKYGVLYSRRLCRLEEGQRASTYPIIRLVSVRIIIRNLGQWGKSKHAVYWGMQATRVPTCHFELSTSNVTRRIGLWINSSLPYHLP